MDLRLRRAGDAALVVELPASLDLETNARVVGIAEAIRRQFPAVIRDAVVGYHSVTVYFDPLRVDPRWLEDRLYETSTDPEMAPEDAGALIEVPVCYGADLGPDLATVAEMAGCTAAQVVERHTSVEYRVFVVGFVPGFAYMGILDASLAGVPRRSTPRPRVPAGSVAIAAGQTGIYPMETPGGWHLLGRTPVRPFDATRKQPVLFRPGDRVRFTSVDADEFGRLGGSWQP